MKWNETHGPHSVVLEVIKTLCQLRFDIEAMDPKVLGEMNILQKELMEEAERTKNEQDPHLFEERDK